MASSDELELDEEVKELLENYKFRRATIYEPCTLKNIKECLIGFSEELNLLNIFYIFNPHSDIVNNTLEPQALVSLINSGWNLLHKYKSVSETANRLAERNHVLEHNNKQLNGIIGRLKDKVALEKSESRACVASAQRIADHSSETAQKLHDSRANLLQVTRQKLSSEKCLHNEIARLRIDNEKLRDKLRNKGLTHTTCSEVCNETLSELKEKERCQQAIIVKLQNNNQELLQELLNLKEEIILEGVENLSFNNS